MNAPARNAALAPIAHPPEDARFDAAYEALRAELAKLDAPIGGTVDWSSVERLALDVLSRVSKDALVAAQLAVAGARLHGVEGFASGLELVTQLFERYGASLEPARPRARGNAIAWLVEHGARALDASRACTPSDALARLSASVDALGAGLDAALGDALPSFAPLHEAIARLASGPKSEPPTEREVATTASEPVPVSEASSTASEPAPVTEAAPELSLASLVAPFLEPISAQSPAGADAKYDASYGALDREIAKLASASAIGPGWKGVAEAAERLLRGVTKDLLVACYLGAAWVELEGIDAVPRAIALPAALLERFGDSLFPPAERAKRRANALAFLFDRVAPRLAAHVPTSDDHERAERIRAVVRASVGVVREKLGNDAPATRPLLEAAERFVLGLPHVEKASARVERPSSPSVEPSAASSAPSIELPKAKEPPAISAPPPNVAPASLEELPSYLTRTGQALAEVALTARRAAPAEPRAYRVLRSGLYLHLESVPLRRPDGSTAVPPPPEALFERVATMSAHGKWEAILEECEGALLRNRFAFALHRHTVTALDALGYESAKKVVVAEVTALFVRLPDLPSLTFANAQPFADATTRRLFEPPRAARGVDGGTDGERETELRAAFESALRDGSLDASLLAADAFVTSAREGRDRFRARLSIATTLALYGRNDLARLFHEALDDEARTRSLSSWDPALCLAHLEAFAEVERALSPTGAESPRVAELGARIAHLSPGALARWAR